MKRITFSADEHLIDTARSAARAQGTTLNSPFRKRLEQFADGAGSAKQAQKLMYRLPYVKSGGRFTRDEMNER
jgi:hypothetical protein